MMPMNSEEKVHPSHEVTARSAIRSVASTSPLATGVTPPVAGTASVGALIDEEKRTYDEVREKVARIVASRVPPKYAGVAEVVLFLPDFVVLIFRLLKDPRVSAAAKAKLVLFTVYLVSPIDIIPDFIPVIGQLDDLVVAVLVIRDILKSTPREVVLEHWSGHEDVIKTIQVVLDVAGEVLGKNMLGAILRYLTRVKPDTGGSRAAGSQGSKAGGPASTPGSKS